MDRSPAKAHVLWHDNAPNGPEALTVKAAILLLLSCPLAPAAAVPRPYHDRHQRCRCRREHRYAGCREQDPRGGRRHDAAGKGAPCLVGRGSAWSLQSRCRCSNDRSAVTDGRCPLLPQCLSAWRTAAAAFPRRQKGSTANGNSTGMYAASMLPCMQAVTVRHVQMYVWRSPPHGTAVEPPFPVRLAAATVPVRCSEGDSMQRRLAYGALNTCTACQGAGHASTNNIKIQCARQAGLGLVCVMQRTDGGSKQRVPGIAIAVPPKNRMSHSHAWSYVAVHIALCVHVAAIHHAHSLL